MKHKTIFLLNAVMLVINGLAFLLFTNFLMNTYGASIGPVGIVAARFTGGVQLSNALLMWLTRDTAGTPTARIVSIQQFVAWLIALGVMILAQIQGIFNTLMWGNVLIGAFFTLAFGYLAFFKE